MAGAGQQQLVNVRPRPRFLEVRNWERFQHYRDRKPIWIKFYVETLDDTELRRLPYATRLLFDQMLLLAARFDNLIPNDPEEIASLTRIDFASVEESLQLLLDGAWLREKRASKSASKPLAQPEQGASPRARPRARGEAEAEAEAEEEKEKGRTEARPPAREPVTTNSLPFEKERLTTEILATIGNDADEGTPDVVRSLAAQLPVASLAKVKESIARNRPDDRAAYIVGALKAEATESGLVVGSRTERLKRDEPERYVREMGRSLDEPALERFLTEYVPDENKRIELRDIHADETRTTTHTN